MWRHRDALIHYRVEQANQHLLAASQLLVRHRHGPSVVSSYSAMFYAVLAMIAMGKHRLARYAGIVTLFERDFVGIGPLTDAHAEWLREAFYLRQRANHAEAVPVSQRRASELLERAEVFVSEIRRAITRRQEETLAERLKFSLTRTAELTSGASVTSHPV